MASIHQQSTDTPLTLLALADDYHPNKIYFFANIPKRFVVITIATYLLNLTMDSTGDLPN